MTRRSKSYFSSVNPPPLQKLSKTHFHKKGFALSLVLKVRVFGIRKWPVACENVKAKPVILNILQSTSVFIAAEKKRTIRSNFQVVVSELARVISSLPRRRS